MLLPSGYNVRIAIKHNELTFSHWYLSIRCAALVTEQNKTLRGTAKWNKHASGKMSWKGEGLASAEHIVCMCRFLWGGESEVGIAEEMPRGRPRFQSCVLWRCAGSDRCNWGCGTFEVTSDSHWGNVWQAVKKWRLELGGRERWAPGEMWLRWVCQG